MDEQILKPRMKRVGSAGCASVPTHLAAPGSFEIGSDDGLIRPELLAPAGDPASLTAAIKAGADAVYCGLGGANMRANSRNFSHPEYETGVKRLHEVGCRAYLTLNTIVFDGELEQIKRTLDFAKFAETDAVIAWDPAVITACRERGLSVHVSTQASIANLQAVKFYESMGVEAVVLARELSLEQIMQIRGGTGLKLECFIHGAMCVAVSGRCFMSQYSSGRSANRGDCLQPCRYPYRIYDQDHGREFELFEDAVMSPQDLCTLPILDRLLAAGINIFKIEGRARGADYVATVTEVYRSWLDALLAGTADEKLRQCLTARLEHVFHRGFSTGFYLGRPLDAWAGENNAASRRKQYLGRVVRVYPGIRVAEIRVEARKLQKGEQLLIIGPNCGACQLTVESMEMDHSQVELAEQGCHVGVRLPEIDGVRRNDKVFVIEHVPTS